MSSPFSGIALRTLCWLAVALELLLGLLILVLLGTTELYALVPLEVTATVVLGLAPVLAACMATRNPRSASRVALCVTPSAVFLNRLPLYSFYFPLRLIVAMMTTLVPGLFWLIAARRNWPLPLSRELFPRRPFLRLLAVISLMLIVLAGSVVLSLTLPWWPPIGDCNGGPLLDENGKTEGIDFTATILLVGPETHHGYSLFSVARVDQRFSDSIWRVPNVVILRDFFHSTDRGEHFFVEGKRSRAPFTRFLPVVERVECGHSKRASSAVAELRTLHDGAPRNGVRVIGAVFTSWRKPQPSSGIEVLIKGPSGATTVVTDDAGVYDIVGLPFGRYTVELSTKDVHPVCVNLEKRAVSGCSLFLDEARQHAN
jgi:hypothetical protein